MEDFLWIFHWETTREKSTCGGKHSIFMLPAAKSRWLIFKKNNVIAYIREIAQLYEAVTLSNYSAVLHLHSNSVKQFISFAFNQL
jgi:hypothetical protein